MRIDNRTPNMPTVEEVLDDPSLMETVAELSAAAIVEEQRKTAGAKLEHKANEAKSKGARSWLA